MKILSIANCQPLPHLGSGYVIDGFRAGLSALGHEVTLIGPEVFTVINSLSPRATSYRQAAGMLLETLRRRPLDQFDIIEFWGGEACLAAWFATKSPRRRYRVVQHTNGPEPRYHEISCEYGFSSPSFLQHRYNVNVVPLAFSRPDGVVTVSRADADWLAAKRFPRSGKRLAIEIPLDPVFENRIPPLRQELLLGFCGTWLQKKGINILIPAAIRLLTEHPTWKLLILGTNGSPAIAASFPAHLRGQVEVADFIKGKESLARQYERISVFLFPSLLESFGIALAEAMACGCAPVVNPVGFAAALRQGEEALVMESLTPEALYHNAKRLIEDVPLRAQIARGSMARVRGWNWDSACRRIEGFYQSLLSEPVSH